MILFHVFLASQQSIESFGMLFAASELPGRTNTVPYECTAIATWSVESDYAVYLTQQRDGWTLGLDPGGALRELGRYYDRAIAVRSARASVVT